MILFFLQVEHLFDEEEDELVKPTKKSSSMLPSLNNGDLPSFMKPTKSYEAATTLQSIEAQSRPKLHSDSTDISHRLSSHNGSGGGELPSFMKPTKNFELRDKHNEVIFPEEELPILERRQANRRRPVSVMEGELPSYMKTTKSHILREHAIASGTVEPDSLEMALKGPLIDEPEPTAPAATLGLKKKSVGGFLKKKFGLSKGESMCLS